MNSIAKRVLVTVHIESPASNRPGLVTVQVPMASGVETFEVPSNRADDKALADSLAEHLRPVIESWVRQQ